MLPNKISGSRYKFELKKSMFYIGKEAPGFTGCPEAGRNCQYKGERNVQKVVGGEEGLNALTEQIRGDPQVRYSPLPTLTVSPIL